MLAARKPLVVAKLPQTGLQRAVFPLADRADDEPAADRLTHRLTAHEQTAWMLRSLLEMNEPRLLREYKTITEHREAGE